MTFSPLTRATPSRPVQIARWAVQILLAAAFLAAGGAKLAGAPMMVQVFDHIGIGQWFRYVTGSVEILGALLLLTPGLSVFGAGLLAWTMTCAVVTHLTVIGGNPIPAIVLLVLNLLVLWLRRDEVAQLAARARP